MKSVDISAKCYTWYMTDDPTARIVAYQWWPNGRFYSAMTVGRLLFLHRKEPGDTWGPPVEIDTVPWTMAQGIADREGFTVVVIER